MNNKTEIIKYNLTDPNADIMILKNTYINNNIININNESYSKIFLPTMYKSWTYKQTPHINFNIKQNDNIDIENNDILYIFDTWGISSYYHLLIDHIIPLWITKNYIEELFLKKNLKIDNSYYYRVSNNNYNKELSTSNEIFKYFLKNNYKENINGKFKYIIYGYCFNHRPYQGPNYKISYYDNYQFLLDKFICEFKKESTLHKKEKYIIIPERSTRTNNIIIEDIYNSLNKIYNVLKIDFSKYSISEQIEICSSSWAMIGCEGVAFANQIFMKKGSQIIVLCNEKDIDHIPFQSTIAKYMNHYFHTITFSNNITKNYNIIEKILNILNNSNTNIKI